MSSFYSPPDGTPAAEAPFFLAKLTSTTLNSNLKCISFMFSKTGSDSMITLQTRVLLFKVFQCLNFDDIPQTISINYKFKDHLFVLFKGFKGCRDYFV